jgi:hypothetical protein
MRIIHFSDIHLADKNYHYFVTVFRKALINDLKSQLTLGSFDLIIISGDLVDKGGFSLYNIREYKGREHEISPFQIFEQLFIEPISIELSIPKSKFLFVPGNHDVDENVILLKQESMLIEKIIACNHQISEIIEENEANFEYSKRIERFKKFEKGYHSTNDKYLYTNNQSTFIYQADNGVKYGFLLLNDSWRCKSVQLLIEEKKSFKLNLGSKQIYDGLNSLKMQNVDVKICVMHHPLEKFNDCKEIKALFIKEIDLVLYGDLHESDFNIPQEIMGNYIACQSKATYNNHLQKDVDYRSGYQIYELSKYALVSAEFRDYDGRTNQSRFLPDVSKSKDGKSGVYRGENDNGISFKNKVGFFSDEMNKFKKI